MRKAILGIIFGIAITPSVWASCATHETMDKIVAYFKQIGEDRIVDQNKQKTYFTPDFKMIIHGKTILNNNAQSLTEHFEHILSQIDNLKLELHDKICERDYCVLRYDLTEPTKGVTHVMAIFKFRQGQCYEMNEVFHTKNKEQAIDVSK